jgi:hypothetical protein
MFATSLVSNQFATMLTLSGSPVFFNAGDGGSAYPRANYLSGGHILGSYILGAYTAFPPDSDVQQLTIVISTNQGESWDLTGTVATKPISEGTLDNPYPLQSPSGAVLLAYRNHDKDGQKEDGTDNWTVYRITLSQSHDLGVNWEHLCDAVVVEATDQNNGVWEPFLRYSEQDKKLQLYYSHERSADDQDNVFITSSDGGLTWSEEYPVSGDEQPTSRDGMVGVVKVSENNLLAVFESNDDGGVFSVNCISSSNNGATWDNRRRLYAPQNATKNAGAPQVAKVGQMLVVSFMTDEDDEDAQWPTITGAKLIVSHDGG